MFDLLFVLKIDRLFVLKEVIGVASRGLYTKFEVYIGDIYLIYAEVEYRCGLLSFRCI